MTIIDLDKQKRKIATDEFKINMDKMLLFCQAALAVVSSKNILMLPQNDEGIKQLDDLVKVCKIFSEVKK